MVEEVVEGAMVRSKWQGGQEKLGRGKEAVGKRVAGRTRENEVGERRRKESEEGNENRDPSRRQKGLG